MSVPQQSNSNPGSGDNDGGGTPPATPPADAGQSQAPAQSTDFDPSTLTLDQINQVLEKNPEVWKAERLARLREKGAKYDKLESEKTAAEQKALEEQGKFKELSEKQSQTITELQSQLKTSSINQALINKLAPLGVVDLEAALALVNRSKIDVGTDGAVTGVDEAIETLKKDKAYLFGTGPQQPNVGAPSNPAGGQQPSGPTKFKRSQLTPEFIAANREAVHQAAQAGQIEDDGPPPR